MLEGNTVQKWVTRHWVYTIIAMIFSAQPSVRRQCAKGVVWQLIDCNGQGQWIMGGEMCGHLYTAYQPCTVGQALSN